jgi:hypothetical protein
MNNFESKYYAATVGDANLAEQDQIWQFIIGSFAAKAAMIPKRT